MGFLKRLHLLRSFCFNNCVIQARLLSSSVTHWEGVNFTNSSGLLIRPLCNIANVSEIESFECDEIVDDGPAKNKHIALHVALTQLESHFEKESMLSLPNFFIPRCASVISTGSLKLDLALGIGGLPKGRIVEIYGKEASGKTTLALHVIKEAQKLGGYCAYLDVENAMDPILAEAIGVNTKNLLISCPHSAENMLSIVDKLTQSGALDVIVVDSVAALVPQCELDGDIGTSRKGVLSKIMTKALRRIHYSLCRSKTLIIFLNQLRYSPRSNQSLGKREEVTCGGNSLGFYAAVRLRTSRTGLLKMNDETSNMRYVVTPLTGDLYLAMPAPAFVFNQVTGVKICVQVMKNKLAPGMKSAESGIDFGKGLRFEPEVLQLALEHGLIIKEGNGYFIEGEVLNGEQAAERYLAENKEVLEKVIMDLRHRLFDRN